jgi:hypothetical protein
MRDKGKFIKGQHYSPSTEFKKGEHWRERKPFWNKEWLFTEYIINNRSTSDIAKQFDITDSSIIHWLKKHKIKRRSISAARAVKHWGSPGSKNPMFGKKDELSSNWKGGICPERQKLYSSLEWKNARRTVMLRDECLCKRCGKDIKDREMHIHHIIPFSNKKHQLNPDNLVTLCRNCHVFVHSKENTRHEYIQ